MVLFRRATPDGALLADTREEDVTNWRRIR